MSKRQIGKGALISYIAIFVNIFAGLLYTPWMIQKIGRADYGLYVLMTSVLTYFVVDYGLGQAVSRSLASYNAENNTKGISNLLGVTAKLYLILDLFIIIAIIVFYFFIDKVFIELSPAEIVKFKDIYIIASSFSILSFPLLYISGVYYALELFYQVKIIDLISKLATVAFTIAVLLFGYGLRTLVLVYAATPFIANICKVLYLNNKGLLNINWKYWSKSKLKGLLNTSIWLFIILVGEVFFKNISPSILAIFSGTEEIAVFAIANTLDNYLLMFGAALNGLFLPKVTNLMKQKNPEKTIGSLMIKLGRFQFILVGLLTLGIILLGKDFIYLWVGVHFNMSYYAVILLIIPTFLFCIIQLGTTYILATNKLKYQAYIYIFAAIGNIILAILLTPKYGAVGSAMAIFANKLVFYIAGLTLIYRKILFLDMAKVYRSIFKNTLIPIIITAAVIVGVKKLDLIQDNLISFAVNSFILIITFAILLYKFFLNYNEKIIFKNIISKVRFKLMR